MVRRPARFAPAAAERIEVVYGDVTDAPAVERALAGATQVYHLAACAQAWMPDPEEFHRVNQLGTETVCRACRLHAVARLIHFSTPLAADPSRLMTPYQRTKAAAEEAVRQYVEEGGNAVIVRPTRVYGPGPLTKANSTTRIIDLYRRGLFRVRIADGGTRANYVFVEDVVAGAVSAAARGARGAAYDIGSENMTLTEFLGTVARVTGRRRTVVPLPRSVAGGIAAAAELGRRIGIEPMVTRDWVRLLALDWPVSSDLARRDLGYQPRGTDEGVAATVRWLANGATWPSA
jgi:farnesol dehydrogenase